MKAANFDRKLEADIVRMVLASPKGLASTILRQLKAEKRSGKYGLEYIRDVRRVVNAVLREQAKKS